MTRAPGPSRRGHATYPDDRVKRNAPGFPFLLTFGDSARFSRSLLRRARVAARGARGVAARGFLRARAERRVSSRRPGGGGNGAASTPPPSPVGFLHLFGRRKRARVSGVLNEPRWTLVSAGDAGARGTRTAGLARIAGATISRCLASCSDAATAVYADIVGVARFGGARALGVTRCVSAAPTWCQTRCGGRGLARSEPFRNFFRFSPTPLDRSPSPSRRALRENGRAKRPAATRARRGPLPHRPARGSRHTPRPSSIPRDDPPFLPTSLALAPPRAAPVALSLARPPSAPRP